MPRCQSITTRRVTRQCARQLCRSQSLPPSGWRRSLHWPRQGRCAASARAGSRAESWPTLRAPTLVRALPCRSSFDVESRPRGDCAAHRSARASLRFRDASTRRRSTLFTPSNLGPRTGRSRARPPWSFCICMSTSRERHSPTRRPALATRRHSWLVDTWSARSFSSPRCVCARQTATWRWQPTSAIARPSGAPAAN